MANSIHGELTDSEPYRNLQWHAAFQAILQIELEEDMEFLQIYKEHPLSEKSLLADIVVVKSDQGRVIKQSIGYLFRQHNIIEYKSPDDYVSVNDFIRVLGYTCIYQSNTSRVMEISPTELTMSFVSSHYPQHLIDFLKREFEAEVIEVYQGIYYVVDFIFPVQFILVHKLPTEEYLWLTRLRGNLTLEADFIPLAKAYRGNEKHPLYEAAMEIIIRANRDICEEGIHMCEALRELFADELEARERIGREAGVAIGREELLKQQIERKRKKGKPIEIIAEELEVSIQSITWLLEGRSLLS